MSNSLVDKKETKFIKKSNVIVRTITNDTSGLLTQRLFNFTTSLIKFNINFNGVVRVNLNDFCIFHNINNTNLYEKVIHNKKEISVIEKEIDNITSLKFWLQDDSLEKLLLKSQIQHSDTFAKNTVKLDTIWTNPTYWRQKQAYEELIAEIM